MKFSLALLIYSIAFSILYADSSGTKSVISVESDFVKELESKGLSSLNELVQTIPTYSPSSQAGVEQIFTTGGQTWPNHNIRVSNISKSYYPFKYPIYEASSYNEEQILLLENRKNNIRYELLSTRVGSDLGITNDDFREHYRDLLKDRKKTIITESKESINGIEWNVIQAKGKFKGKNVSDYHYITYVNGVAYTQLIWGYKSKTSFAKVKQAADEIVQNFEIADSNFHTYSTAFHKKTNANVENLGLSLDLNGQNYVIENASAANERSFHSSLINNVFFSLIPIHIGEARLSLSEVIRGFETLLEASYTNSSEIKRKPVPGTRGKEVDFVYFLPDEEGEDAGKVTVRISKSENIVYCIQFIDYSDDFALDDTEDSEFYKLLSNLKIEAINAEPLLTDVQVNEHANFFNGIGLFNVETNNINKAITYFTKAQDLAPDSQQISINLIQTLVLHGSFEKALALTQDALLAYPDDYNLLQALGICSFNLHQPGKGIDAYHKIFFELDIQNANLINEYLGYLFNDRNFQLMLESVHELEKLNSDPLTLTYWKVAALRDSGKLDLALESSEQLYEMEPENINMASMHVDVLLKKQENAEALRVCEEFIDATGNLQMNYFTGLCYIAQKQYAPARDVLQECLDVMPGHVGARELLNHIHGLMGGTDPSLFNSPIKAVELDPSIRSIEAEYPQEQLERKGVYGEYVGDAFHYEKGLPQKHTRYMTFKILDEKGAQEFKEMTESFNPSYERIFVNEANVYDESGELVGTGNLNQFYITNLGDDSIINEEKNLHITFPNVSIGCTVSLVVTRETIGPVDKFHFKNPILSGTYPRKFTFAQVTGDIDSVAWKQNFDTIEFRPTKDKLIWHTDYPNVFENVLYAPDITSYMPMLWISSKEDESWGKIADEYYSDIQEYLDTTSPSCEQIASALNHDDTVKSKIDAVMAYISSNYTYKAILFGPKARIPRTFSEIEANKFGDCKDHTVVAIQLLRELGIEAHPSLVNTYRVANSDAISLDQFDHMIVYVPEATENQFIDPTDHFLAKSYRPQRLDGQPALVIKKNGSFLDTIDQYRDIDNRISIQRDINLSGANDTLIKEKVTAKGITASFIRQMLYNVPEGEQTKVIQSYLKQAEPSISIKDLIFENLEDRHKPLNLSYKYSVSRKFTSDGKTFQGRCPTTWDNLYYYHNNTNIDRTIPFKITVPLSLDLSIQITAPSNYSISNQSLLSDFNESDKFGGQIRHKNTSLSDSPNTISLNYQFNVSSETFEASEYSNYVEHAEKAINRLSLPVSFDIK
ncbi:DUF3857 domain-containing protein [Puniceicoccaceae bacterium K14]|nr:DUF3857 domain-containing protein [Puniceicoccaceae bacterium K14]